MKASKNYTIQVSNTWELIPTTYDAGGFSFWTSGDIEYTDKSTPSPDDILPIYQWNVYKSARPIPLFVRWTAGQQVFISPFESVSLATDLTWVAGIAKETTLLQIRDNALRLKYSVVNLDENGVTNYYWYTSPEGYWYIMKEVVATWDFTYASGTTPYWANRTWRAGLAYTQYLILS